MSLGTASGLPIRAFHVCSSTMPVSASPLHAWKVITAAWVASPYIHQRCSSSSQPKPCFSSATWQWCTAAPPSSSRRIGHFSKRTSSESVLPAPGGAGALAPSPPLSAGSAGFFSSFRKAKTSLVAAAPALPAPASPASPAPAGCTSGGISAASTRRKPGPSSLAQDSRSQTPVSGSPFIACHVSSAVSVWCPKYHSSISSSPQ
mmetsp:Transcript_2094/g.5163  ORF Transcript_2094/g.5163 Transcript_2094/m.5163 type:complete len:204 (+) Transcript_2094:153-764(+)